MEETKEGNGDLAEMINDRLSDKTEDLSEDENDSDPNRRWNALCTVRGGAFEKTEAYSDLQYLLEEGRKQIYKDTFALLKDVFRRGEKE